MTVTFWGTVGSGKVISTSRYRMPSCTFFALIAAVDPAFAEQVENDLAAGRSEKEKTEALRREEAKCFRSGIVIPGRAAQPEDEGQSAYVKDDGEDL